MRFVVALHRYFREVAAALSVGAVGGLLMNTLVVLPALALGRAIDTATAFAAGTKSADDVAVAALFVVSATLATEGPRVVKRWFLVSSRQRMVASIRADAVDGALRWPIARLLATPVGSLLSRINGDVEVLGVSLKEVITETWDSLVFSISLLVGMTLIDVKLALLFGFPPVLVAMLVSLWSGRVVGPQTHAARAKSAELVSAIHERLVGGRVLTLLRATRQAVDEVERRSTAQAQANVAVVRLAGSLKGIYATLVNAGAVVVIIVGGGDVIDHTLTLGTFVAFLELYRRFVDRAHRVPQMINALQSGQAAYARIEGMLTTTAATTDAVGAVDARGDVSLRDLTVAYGDATVLDGVNLEIAAGSFVAVTGAVGAGKSALARALAGIAPIVRGSVEVRGRIAYVPDDPQLFSGTLADNVRFGADGDFVQLAIEAAALGDDVAGFADGVNTQIGELGVRVSGGQRKRIAVARALAAWAPAWPSLLVLDDPFSSVDPATELAMITRVRALCSERGITVVLVSHRLAAFPLADRVLVLERGRVVQDGKHADLVDVDGWYRTVFRAQRVAS